MDDIKMIIIDAGEVDDVPAAARMEAVDTYQGVKVPFLTREEIESMLKDEEEEDNFEFRPKEKKKNSSARWDNFELIYYKGRIQEYIRCVHCKRLIAHRRGTGLAGLIRHRCDRRRRSTRIKAANKFRYCLVPNIKEKHGVSSITSYQLEYIVTDMVNPKCFEGIGFQRLAHRLVLHGAQHGTAMPALLTGPDLATRVLPIKVHSLKMKIGQLLVEQEVAFSFEVWDTCSNNKCVSLDGQCLTNDFRMSSFHMGSRIIKDSDSQSITDGLVSIVKDYVTAAEEKLAENILVGDEIFCSAAAIDEIVKAAESMGGPLKDGCKIELDDSSEPLDSISQFYKVFHDCYTSLTTNGKPTINEVYLWRKTLENHLSPLPTDDFVVKQMKEKASLSLHKFQLHHYHFIGLFLDPRFKSLKCCSEEDRLNVLELVKEAIAKEESNGGGEHQKNLPKPGNYFKEFLDSDDEGNSITAVDSPIDVELRNYQALKLKSSDVLQFWSMNQSFPRLKRLAQKILNVPAAAQRNIFLDDIKLYIDKRPYIENDNMENVLFLNQNLSKGFISSLVDI